ncbi:MAG: hypothetical protein Q9219_006488 [cf. Caloplaca sp. 3 TL-2023]
MKTSSSASASATAVASSEAAEASASATSTASSAASASASETAAAGTGTTNGTAAATSSSSSAATSSAFLPDTPKDLRCHIDRETQEKPEEDIANPFCSPTQGQHVFVGSTYNVTWDPTLFAYNSTNVVEVKHANTTTPTNPTSPDPANNTENNNLGYSAPLPNEKGFWTMEMHQEYLQDHRNNTPLTLFIRSKSPSGEPVIKSGPVFSLATMNATDVKNSTSSHGKGNDLGEKAGIPVGLGVFLIAAAGLLFWFLRRRRNNSAGYMSKRGAVTGTRDLAGGGERGFRDEPTRGLELQDRGAGHGRQDSWEAGWDTGSSQGGGGNAFRDEIDRQRRR